jgi:alpha-galactosidase
VFAGAYDPQADYAALKPVKEAVVALGTVTEMLPSVDGPHTVAVKAFIEVPISGLYEFHAGSGPDAHVMISLPGVKVYQKEPGKAPVIQKVPLLKGQRYPVALMYPKGGPAIFWMEQVDIKGKGDLEWVVKELGIYKCLVDDKGAWTNRSDVIYTDAYLGNGSSTPLGPTSNGRSIGPELGFGYVMGAFHDEPVLLIKSCIGNRSLSWDYLPPGSERYEMVEKDPATGVEKTYVYAGYKDSPDRWEKGTQPQPGGWYAGKQYDECTAAVKKVLENFGTKYPEFKDQGYEVAGFVWFQGHKDTGSDLTASRYEQNLVNLIKAWRKEFNAPDAKFVVATGCGNPGREGRGLTIAEAQLAVDGDKGKYPEFKGNVKSVDSRGYWREVSESPGAKGYHYNLNAETYLLTGDALGRAMVQLLGGKADPTPGVCRPYSAPKPWPKNPTPEQGVEMIYSDAFMWSWVTDPAEPTPDQMAAMAPALKPIILDKVIPGYLTTQVPGYLHHGLYLAPLITGQKPPNVGVELDSDLDGLFNCYKAAGINDYGWQSFGPEMKNATWDYLSFDPAEKFDPAKGERYREITYPGGITNWFAVDFDAKKAGWKSGAAPFGQKDGQPVALREKCTNPQCGCGSAPKTLWENEVLLMRQTFDIPKMNPDSRYRLVVGGSAHNFAGEGFALYVNGKLFAESKSGYNKTGSNGRGGYIFSDFMPEFQGGKVTIAVKSFLRYTRWANKPAPATGHLSVWMEEAKIPEVVLTTFKTEAVKK